MNELDFNEAAVYVQLWRGTPDYLRTKEAVEAHRMEFRPPVAIAPHNDRVVV